ncbi:hypothetical protein BDZ45DRAFT_740856 [Acephala macrosclerotiorum]|nr:hypothetical protein BDZ45DRAFT_740856 [Acephala macrosclerotiorum]
MFFGRGAAAKPNKESASSNTKSFPVSGVWGPVVMSLFQQGQKLEVVEDSEVYLYYSRAGAQLVLIGRGGEGRGGQARPGKGKFKAVDGWMDGVGLVGEGREGSRDDLVILPNVGLNPEYRDQKGSDKDESARCTMRDASWIRLRPARAGRAAKAAPNKARALKTNVRTTLCATQRSTSGSTWLRGDKQARSALGRGTWLWLAWLAWLAWLEGLAWMLVEMHIRTPFLAWYTRTFADGHTGHGDGFEAYFIPQHSDHNPFSAWKKWQNRHLDQCLRRSYSDSFFFLLPKPPRTSRPWVHARQPFSMAHRSHRYFRWCPVPLMQRPAQSAQQRDAPKNTPQVLSKQLHSSLTITSVHSKSASRNAKEASRYEPGAAAPADQAIRHHHPPRETSSRHQHLTSEPPKKAPLCIIIVVVVHSYLAHHRFVACLRAKLTRPVEPWIALRCT